MASQTRIAGDAETGGKPSVASEMEAIFAPLPRFMTVSEPILPPDPAPVPPRRRKLGLALALIVLLAAAIGTFLFLNPMQNRHAPRQIVLPRLTDAAPAKAPAKVAPSPIPIAPVRAAAQPSPVRQGPPVPKVRPSAKAPLKPKTKGRAKSAVNTGSSPQPTLVAAPTPHEACPSGAAESWCLRDKVTAADKDLRDAYDAATRAGVPRKTMVKIRNDWKKLRGRANRDPQALIRGFGQLTQQLHTESGKAPQ